MNEILLYEYVYYKVLSYRKITVRERKYFFAFIDVGHFNNILSGVTFSTTFYICNYET